MSDTVKLESVKGVVEQVNKGGIKVAGTWYDFDRSFKGDKPGKDVVDSEIELAVANGGNGKKYIHAFEVCGEIEGDLDGDEPAAAPETPGEDRVTEAQTKYVNQLLERAALTREDLEQLSQIRFKKPFGDLTKREGSWTISYLGGGDSPGRHRARQQ